MRGSLLSMMLVALTLAGWRGSAGGEPGSRQQPGPSAMLRPVRGADELRSPVAMSALDARIADDGALARPDADGANVEFGFIDERASSMATPERRSAYLPEADRELLQARSTAAFPASASRPRAQTALYRFEAGGHSTFGDPAPPIMGP